MKNFKEIRRKLALTAAAGGIAFGGMLGAEKAVAQDGGDEKQHPDSARAQVVPEESLGKPSNIAVIEDPGEVPPLGEEELAVGESFYLGSIEQEVTVMYADRYMRLLMPDEMGGDPHYYQPIEKIEVNPEHTPETLKENIWDVYWPQVYFDLIQNGKLTQDGKTYAEVLGVQGNVSTETILQALRKLDGQWPLVPYRYKWGSNGQEDLYAEGYANPNLPINVIPLPRNLTPPAFGNEPIKPWIEVETYYDSVVPSYPIGVLIDPETGQISLYKFLLADVPTSKKIPFDLYRIETVFTTEHGIRPEIPNKNDSWFFDWWMTTIDFFPLLTA